MKYRFTQLTMVVLSASAIATSVAFAKNTKSPVPPAAEQAAAMKLVKEIYGADYAKAESLEAKQSLAKTLLEKAKGTRDDLPGKFVLLRLSRDVATQGLDGLTAFQAVDAIAETFEIDPVEMKAAVLKHGAEHAKEKQHHKQLMEVALSLVDPAVTEDNYSVAKQLCDFAADEATSANESDTRTIAIARGSEVENVLAVLYEKAQNATPLLNADPINPEANTAMGKYLCFVKNDWERGNLMLALGSDVSLKALALQELDESSPKRPEQVGDGWWDRAANESGIIKTRFQDRAAFWYREALPGLSGLSKDRVKKRLDSLTVQHPATNVAEQPRPRQTDLGEHNHWSVPHTWTEQVQKYKTIIEYSPQGGNHSQHQVPYMATVHHHDTQNVEGKLVNFDYKTGNVMLKIKIKEGKKEQEVTRSFRYAALGDDDKKYLDLVKRKLMGP